jgi:hypothetical protein
MCSIGGTHSCCHCMCSLASASSMAVHAESGVMFHLFSRGTSAKCVNAATSVACCNLSLRRYLCAKAAIMVSMVCGRSPRYAVKSAPCPTVSHTGEGYPMVCCIK